MFINDFFKAGVTESKQAVSDYDTWRDQVDAAGGEIHPQQDRVHLVAQSWDGDIIGEFNLKTNQGWFGQQGVAEDQATRTCPQCDGSGEDTLDPTKSCRRCGGKGYIPMPKEPGVAEGWKSKLAGAAATAALAASPNAQGVVVISPNIGAQYQNIKRDQEQRDQEKSKKTGKTFPLSDKSKDAMKEQGVAEDQATRTCPTCDGSGEDTLDHSKPCHRCHGKGHIPQKKGVAEGSEPHFLDDDFYAYDPETMQVKSTWTHKDVGRWHSEHEARERGWKVVSGMRARSLGLHYGDVNEAEGDPEGLPHLTKQLLTHIVQQVGKEGAHAIIKSLEWGDGAADELLQLIVNDLKQDARGEVDETYGGQLHTKHKKNRFKQIKKIKQQKKPFGLSDLTEQGCNMTQEGRTCPVHGIQECPGYGMTETSAQDKLHQHHQEIRKKSGLPHPDHYLKMMKQKQAEIDALRAEIAADKEKGLGEARKPDVNFDIEDIKKLERIRDLPTLKTLAFELISRPSTKPMKPEKVEWFRSALERMDSPLKVIKLMYDLMLSGEGHQVIGSRNSMKANSYRGRFSEATVTPRLNGFQQTTDDDGTVTSDYSVGPVSASTTRRPNTINSTSATVPLAHNVQLTVDKGIGFGGAGKNVTQGGNQVSTITARTAQNPQGTTSSFAGRPTTQDLEKAIPKDWAPSDDEFSDDINEDIERYVDALARAGYELQEEKVRLDPKCWKGKKIGSPKTKMKGGVRVNNCVPK